MRSILLGALVCLSCLALQLPLAKQVDLPFYDEAAYLDFSRGIIETGLPSRSINKSHADLTFRHPPLARYITALVLTLFSNNLHTARLLSSFSSAILLLLFFFWLKRRTNANYAVLFSLILATHSLFLVHAYSLYVEVLLALFCIGGLICFLEYVEALLPASKRNWLIASGFLFAAALCSKYTAVFFLLPVMGWLLLVEKKYKTALLFGGITSSLLLVWFFAAAMVDIELLYTDLFSIQDIVGGAKKVSNASLGWFLSKDFVPAFGITLLIAPLLIGGLLILKKRTALSSWWKKADFVLPSLITLLTIIVTILVSYKRTRYVVPVIPLFIFVVAVMTFELSKQFKEVRAIAILPWIMTLFIVQSSSPLFDGHLKLTKKWLGKPRNFTGTYSQVLAHDDDYRGVKDIALDISRLRQDENEVLLSEWNLALQIHYITGMPYCLGNPCKNAAFLILSDSDQQKRQQTLTQVDSIKNYVMVKSYDNLGTWLGPKTLWRRKGH
jgi:4-amino-4-deoxy-L-arabinose transferase-like glycosyltransferase